VRSSATHEDAPAQSFVGQHATYLNIDGEAQVLEAVVGCWRSLFSAKSLAYARHFGVDLLGASMGVIIQPMIATERTGTLFTADPIDGNPDTFVLETAKEGASPAIERLDPYAAHPGEPPLWNELRRLGLLLDERWHSYQALEWALVGARLYLLRVRPLTRLPAYLPPAEIEPAIARGALGLVQPPGRQPGALAPHSWYQRSRSPHMSLSYLSQAQRLFGAEAGRIDYYLCGYLYTRRLHYSAGAGDLNNAVSRAARSLAQLYAARSLDREFRILWRVQRPRLDVLNDRDLAALADRELAIHLRETIAIGDTFWAQCGRLANSFETLQGMICALYREWFGREPDCAALLWTRLDQHALCLERLDQEARETRDDAQAAQRAWGQFWHRHRHQFVAADALADWADLADLEADEAPVRALWAERAESQGPAASALHEARLAQQAALERHTLASLGRARRLILRHMFHLARRYAPLTYNSREPVLLARLLERTALAEVGRRLASAGAIDDADDVGLLGCSEIIQWLEGDLPAAQVARMAAERREQRRRWNRYTPPIQIGENAGRPAAPEATPAPADTYRGRPVSPGQAHGRARLVHSLSEIGDVLPGEILICRELVFEYSPILDMVAAVVAERDGLLGHSGVLAREYGLPAVFGVAEATRLLHTGDEVQVDATQGSIVHLHPQPDWDILKRYRGGRAKAGKAPGTRQRAGRRIQPLTRRKQAARAEAG
jgi:pyruvate,water dikinase